MIKIISLNINKNNASVFIDARSSYDYYNITSKNITKKQISYPKKEYNNYEHFIGVMGKFNPYIEFYNTPKLINKLTFEELKKIN